LQAIFQTGVDFMMKAVSRKSKPRSFHEIENAMKIALDSFTPCD
jgi:hypothetical protein